MLTRGHRLTSSQGYAHAIRGGRRAGSRTVVVHALEGVEPPQPVRIGLVVSKAVGGAVRRNQVKRRLRHLLRDRVSLLPESSVIVVRALATAADASYAELGADLDAALARALSSGVASGRSA